MFTYAMLLLNVGSNYSIESNQNASHLIILAISAGSRRIKPHAMLTRPTFFYISKMDFGIFLLTLVLLKTTGKFCMRF